MADSQSITTLNIGSQRISMATFSPGKGGLTLKKYQAVDILADPASEGTRNAEVRAAVAQLAKSLKAGKVKVRAAVPGHSVITKFVKLPPIDSDDLGELVSMEAQQQIPFPLSEGAWDWAAIDSPGIEKEVLLVAIRQEILDDISESVAGAGLGLKEVDSSPTALYNAFRYNYPDVNDPVLLLDIGAKSTELIYIEGKKLFIQSVNTPGTTGASLTSAIAKEFGVSFPEAEAHKIGGGMVSLGSTVGMDESTAALSSFIRNSVNRLPGEISRRTNFYRSNQGGGAPTKVYLAGGGVNLPYLADFLQEKLSLPVEAFNPLRRVNAGSVEIAGQEHTLGELVGLAVEGAGKADLHIDLVPTFVEAERASARRLPWLIGAAVATIAGCAAFAGLKSASASKAAEKLAALEEQRSELEPHYNKLSRWNKDLNLVEEIGADYALAQHGRTRWQNLVQEVAGYFASDTVWLTNFSPLVNYEPGNATSGKPYFKGGFDGIAYGESFVDAKTVATGEDAAINAVRIDGIWITGEDGKDHRAVAEILEKIKINVSQAYSEVEESGKEPATFFSLKKADPDHDRIELPLADPEILTNNTTTLAEDSYGAQFTVILPLREAILVSDLLKGKSIN